MTLSRPRSLPLVAPAEQLRGLAPVAFERAARRARVGGDEHFGLLRIGLLIARHAASAAIAPGGRHVVQQAWDALERHMSGAGSLEALKKTRSDTFAGAVEVEQRTVDAVRGLLASSANKLRTELCPHADPVVVRHAGLAAHYAVNTTLMLLDAAAEPGLVAEVVPQAAASVAYQSTAFGPARSPQLRARAMERAVLEAERPFSVAEHGHHAVAVQLFHEFLGSHWKDVSDANRIFFGDVIDWALPATLRAS